MRCDSRYCGIDLGGTTDGAPVAAGRARAHATVDGKQTTVKSKGLRMGKAGVEACRRLTTNNATDGG